MILHSCSSLQYSNKLNCFFLHSLSENKASKKYLCQGPARIELRNQHNLLQVEDYKARKGKKSIYPEAMFSTDWIIVCRESIRC